MIVKSDFFKNNSIKVWKKLLWKKLIFIDNKNNKLSWIINEIESYKWKEDEASHAFKWKTSRNKLMFDSFGCVYIYLIYWMYFCLNFTTENIWIAGAILIRSVIPEDWIEIMKINRNIKNINNLTNWPGKLCQAFGIKKEKNGLKLCKKNRIYIEDINFKIKTKINTWSRIWIKKGRDKMWRMWF